jgi:hypothetical protein
MWMVTQADSTNLERKRITPSIENTWLLLLHGEEEKPSSVDHKLVICFQLHYLHPDSDCVRVKIGVQISLGTKSYFTAPDN